MINFKWNGIDFSITDIGGGKLGKDIPRHAHAKGSYELHFITAGCGKLITDDKTYELKSGDFFITGENTYHQQIADRLKPVEDVFMMLQVNNAQKATAIGSVFLNSQFCFITDFDNSAAVQILNEYRQKQPDFTSAIAGLTMKILADITRKNLPKEFIDNLNYNNLNDRRFVLIEQYFLYSDNLTLTELSNTIGLCERQTQRLLKKYYGKNFREKKKECRNH
ncbi:MAG: cupin domain-containing protein [Eubacterium sp.]|nr:cupin domain-containing protein [Eubacterium sp.]